MGIGKVFIYQNGEKPVSVLVDSIEKFKANPKNHYPDIADEYYVSEDDFPDYKIVGGKVVEKSREDLILEGRTDLLHDGEVVINGIVKAVPITKFFHKPLWKSPNWVEGTTAESLDADIRALCDECVALYDKKDGYSRNCFKELEKETELAIAANIQRREVLVAIKENL